MTTMQEDKGVQVGTTTLKHLAKDVKAEDLDKKWAETPDRPTPSPEDTLTLSMLDTRLGEAKESKHRKHDIWNFSYLQYRSVNHYSMLYGGFPTYWNQWGTGVFIPRTFETIESVKVQIQSKKADFTVSGTKPSNKDFSKKIHSVTKSEWKRSQGQREIGESVHDILVYGTGLVRTDLVNDKQIENVMSWKKEEITKEDGTTETRWTIQYEEKEVQKYYGVGCKRVDPYDFYPNPSPESYRMNKLGWAFERSVVDAWDFREQYRILNESGAHGVTDNWKYIRPGGDVSDYKYLRKEIDTLYSFGGDARTPGNINDLVGRTVGGKKSTTLNKEKLEVWEYWENDRYIVIANGLILRDSPNPYPHKQIPYSKASLVDMNEFFSMGIPEYIRWLQICENILYDQGLNNIIMSVHKMFAVNSRYLEDEGELVARPFGIIHLKQIPNVRIQDAIMPIEYSHNMNNYFEFMQKNTENIQSVTGVSPYQTGGVVENSNTELATVANRLAFAGTARIQEISRHIEDDLITGVIEQMVAIMQFYYQNTSHFEDGILPVEVEEPNKNYFLKYLARSSGEITPEDLRLAEEEGYTGVISQDEIQGRCKVSVTGASSIPKDPDMMAKLKMDFAKFAQEAVISTIDPMTQATVNTPVFDFAKVAKEVAQDVFEIDDAEEYLYKAPEAPTPMTSTAPMIPPTETAIPTESPGETPVTPGGGEVDLSEIQSPEVAEILSAANQQI